MDQAIAESVVLACRFCGKPAKSKSGLTNHEKICPKANNKVAGATVPASDTNPYDRVPERITDRSQDRPQERNHNGSKPSGPKAGPFQFGAFLVMADYVPILLDVDFCIALGNHILEHGSPNSAVMAFAHQLKKLDDE